MPEEKISPWNMEPDDQILSTKLKNNLLSVSTKRKKSLKKPSTRMPIRSVTTPSSPHHSFKVPSKREYQHSKTDIKF